MDMEYGKRTTDDGSDVLPTYTKDKGTKKAFDAGKKYNETGIKRGDALSTPRSELGRDRTSRVSGKKLDQAKADSSRNRQQSSLPSTNKGREIVSISQSDINRVREIAKNYNKNNKDNKVKIQVFNRKDGAKVYIDGDRSAVNAVKGMMPSK